MMNTLLKIVTVAAILFFITACTSAYDKHVQWQAVKPEVFPIILGVGSAPISLQKSENATQRMLMAIKASKIAAYSELAEQIYGQLVTSSSTVADMLIENQQLTSSVQGLIRGAKVVKSYPIGDIYTTELELDFKDVYDIYQANLQRKEIKSVRYF